MLGAALAGAAVVCVSGGTVEVEGAVVVGVVYAGGGVMVLEGGASAGGGGRKVRLFCLGCDSDAGEGESF